MSEHTDKALRLIHRCIQVEYECRLVLEYLEGWYGTEPRPSECLEMGSLFKGVTHERRTLLI
jgi:hypothetical protein